MLVLLLCLAGQVVFALVALGLGAWLRRNPTTANAERSSRVMHLLFFVLQNLFPFVLVFWPGIFSLDGVTGVTPLSPRRRRMARSARSRRSSTARTSTLPPSTTSSGT